MVRPTPCQRGFTYLMLLWWVALAGVILAAAGTVWTTESRRERDIELVFRGQQIARAIQSYYEATPQGPRLPPKTLEDLLEDRRTTPVRHHLRQLWPDPITGSTDWGLVRQGPYIRGVYSTSPHRPLRGPSNCRHYSDWKFMATIGAVTAAAPASSGAEVPAADDGRASASGSSFDLGTSASSAMPSFDLR